jgi:hypothetical protein
MAKKRKSYPWSVLGIEKTDSVADIKRAYAIKLKVTRPDDDATAFQALVAARDRALLLASNQRVTFDSQISDLVREVEKPARKKSKTKSSKLTEDDSSPAGSLSSDGPWDSGQSVHESDSDFIAKIIEQFLTTTEDNPDAKLARCAVSRLASLSISERLELEPRLLESVSKQIQTILYESKYVHKQSSRARAKAWLVHELDSTFGWTENDRRVQGMIWHENEEFSDQLRVLLGRENKPPPQSGQSRPQFFSWSNTGLWVMFVIVLINVLAGLSKRL